MTGTHAPPRLRNKCGEGALLRDDIVDDVSTAIYRDFLPDALASGRCVAAPRPQVVGSGPGDIQHAMDLQRKGVSAAKLVVPGLSCYSRAGPPLTAY